MSASLAVDLLLGLGVAAQLLCCLGVLVMPTVFDRLHFVGAGSTLGPLLIGAAVLVRQTTSAAGIETIVTMALIVLLSPVLLLATVRAARRYEIGRIGPTADERRSAT